MIVRRLGNRTLTLGILAIIALVLCMGFLAASGRGHVAYAAHGELAGANVASEKPSAQIASASTKKSVYLIVKAGDTKCSYNKYGLLTKTEDPSSKVTYKYDKKMRLSKFASVAKNDGARKSKGTFAYDKKGRLTRLVSKGSHSSNDYKITYKYNKKGYPSTEQFIWLSYDATVSYKNTFDKKGRLIKQLNKESDFMQRFGYDSKGNLKMVGSETWTNEYYGGRLAVKTRPNSATTASRAYRYKKISVPGKYVAQVKKQQWALLNPESSFVFPPYF